MTPNETIRTFIKTNFYVPDGIALADDTLLLDLGIVDSTGVLEITAFLEREYGIQIADRDIVTANMDSIGSIAALLAAKTEQARDAGAAAKSQLHEAPSRRVERAGSRLRDNVRTALRRIQGLR